MLLVMLLFEATKNSFATRMRSACEVSACSGLTVVDNPRGCAPIQSSTARLGLQIKCVCASLVWLKAQQDPFLDRSSWCCVVASVARLMPVHPTGPNLRPDWGMVSLHRFPICDTASGTKGRDQWCNSTTVRQYGAVRFIRVLNGTERLKCGTYSIGIFSLPKISQKRSKNPRGCQEIRGSGHAYFQGQPQIYLPTSVLD